MGRRTSTTRSRIIDAAWRLFYRQGYEDTTVEEIIAESGTSRGSFYHYFSGKEALVGTLAQVFDGKYQQLMETMDPEMDRFDQLMLLNRELFALIENSISPELVARMYASQLVTRGDRSLLDRNRTYFRVLRRIVREGQERGELRQDVPEQEIVRVYALCERGLLYDWCLSQGESSLLRSGQTLLPLLFQGYRAGPGTAVPGTGAPGEA